MKLTTVINDKNADFVGEYLRDKFFNQDSGDRGCYSTFEYRLDVVSMPDKKCAFRDYHQSYIILPDLGKVIMEWYWDGDGCLSFEFEDGKFLINEDYKKPSDWKFFNKKDHYINF